MGGWRRAGVAGLCVAAAMASAPSATPAGAAPVGQVTEFSAGITAGAGPASITTGPDGNLWFTENGTDSIGRITATGTVTEFTNGITSGASLVDITTGPDGNLWFTESGTDGIGRITPTGTVTEFTNGISSGASPTGIVAGPDGNLWFTEPGNDSIGRITPAGTVTEFANAISANSGTALIVRGPDGNLWFTEPDGGRIGRITPAGTVTEFANGITPNSAPTGIAAGPDGNLWFTESNGGRIGRITPTGAVTEFSSGITPASTPAGIAKGPDGNLWFTENSSDKVARITPTGTVTEFSAGITSGSAPTFITAGPDANMWFTENTGDRVARILVTGTPAGPGPCVAGPLSPAPSGNITRLAGANRDATAVAVSQAGFPTAGSASAVVLATDAAYPDALAGTPLAAAKHAPLLLTNPSSLTPAVGTEISRVAPKGATVYLLGGDAALAPTIDAAVVALGDIPHRLAGANRFATAVAIAGAQGDPTTILEATGLAFPDALSAGAAAAAAKGAVLLTNGATQAPETAAYLTAHTGDTKDAVGGPAAAADPSATAIVGADRYGTAVQVAQKFFPSPTKLGFASGATFPDALSGGANIAAAGGPMLLVPSCGTLPASLGAYLSSVTPHNPGGFLYGGAFAVGDDVLTQLESAA